ncbi:MAG: phytase [Methylophilaceae bacterium]|nr:MAG: phytase [Methylophilaceae bacterium]
MQISILKHHFVVGITSLSFVLLTACQQTSPAKGGESISFKPLPIKHKVEAAQLIDSSMFAPNVTLTNADVMIASKKHGLLVIDEKGETLSQLKGYFTSVDHRLIPQGMLVASVEGNLQQAVVSIVSQDSGTWSAPLTLPKPNFKIEDACLYQDGGNNAFVFLVGEEGLGEQWLVAADHALLPQALRVRGLSLPPASSFCQVDDRSNTLYVNEENVGLWAYAARAEAELMRQPVAMLTPFGDIEKNVSGMAIANHQVLLIDADSAHLHRYQNNGDSAHAVYKAVLPVALAGLDSPENISVRANGTTLALLVHDKSGLHKATLAIAADDLLNEKGHEVSQILEVKPLIQTDAIPSMGDAADDPAIWMHPNDATKSLVLATDKQGGLAVYDLQGKTQQYLPVGRLNNVDVRTGFNLNGKLIDIAAASNRDNNSLHLFSIDRQSGHVSVLGEHATTIQEMYGICMFKDKQDNFYAIMNDKDGTFEQYQLMAVNGQIATKKARSFKVETQPEGCVAHDQSEQLFIGEEDVAVWTLSARADVPTTMTNVISTNEIVHADIEGIAYYQGAKQDYLVISSQGNDSYVVLDATPPYQVRGNFRIGINALLAIDGASETDGLEVTSADLSGHNTGLWRLGMLVVQDGRKRMPEEKQNFKYVPWTAIAEALNLE